MELIPLKADALRRALWHIGARTALGRLCLRDRAARVSVLAAFHILIALGLTLAAPLWLLLLGPLVLGVPHVLSDVRVLLLSPDRPLSRPQSIALLAPLAAMTLLRAALVLGASLHPSAEGICGAIAVAGVAACSRGRSRIRALCLMGAFGLLVLSLTAPMLLAVVLGHLHNFVAFALWAAFMRPLRNLRNPSGTPTVFGTPMVLILFAAGIAILCSGVGERIAFAAPALGLTVDDLVLTLAPGLPANIALRLLSVFAFAQAVHYALWVRVIPETRADGPPAPTFRRGWRSLQSDLGRAGTAIAILCAIALPVCAFIHPAGPAAIRNTYLSLVLFHGWLELAASARLLVERNSVANSGANSVANPISNTVANSVERRAA